MRGSRSRSTLGSCATDYSNDMWLDICKQHACMCVISEHGCLRFCFRKTQTKIQTICVGLVKTPSSAVSFSSDTSGIAGHILWGFFAIFVGHILLQTHLAMPDISSRNRPNLSWAHFSHRCPGYRSSAVDFASGWVHAIRTITGWADATCLHTSVYTRVLHGPGLGPRAGLARSPWTGPGRASMIFCGPGRVRAWNWQARAGPGLVSNTFAGCGPDLGLTFPGLAGRTVKVTLVLT